MDTFHILVVEDDPDINNLLCRIVMTAVPPFPAVRPPFWLSSTATT